MNLVPLQYERIALDDAGSIVRDYNGHTLYVVNTGGASDLVQMRMNRPDANPVPIGRGFGIEHHAFNRLWLDWDAQAGGYIDIVWGGDANAADERAFRPHPQGSSSAVEVTNDVANAVPVGVQGTVQVNIASVSRRALPSPAGFVAVAVGATTASTTGVLIHTVTAGKKLVIEKAQVCQAGGSNTAILEIRNGATVMLTLACQSERGNVTGWEGVEVPAGYTVYIKSSAGTNASGSICGWEENI